MPTQEFMQGERSPFQSTEQMAVETTPPASPQEFNFSYMVEKARTLIKDWNQECLDTNMRRRQRKIEVSIDQLRKDGRLKADETLIAIRVIDENIRKEQPLYMGYLTGSRRLIIFKNKDVDKHNIAKLESEVTEGLQYAGWQMPYFGVIDGAECHGWDSVEVVYNANKPLKVATEHVGHDDLLFHRDAIDLEACPFILRRYSMSPMTLKGMVTEFGFDAAQVELLVEENNNQTGALAKNLSIYKIKFKVDGLVYVAWFHESKGTDWLKAPEPFFNGRREQITVTVPVEQPSVDPMTGQPVMITVPQEQTSWQDIQEKLYYVSIFQYIKTEEKIITCGKGRCFYDLPYQEAATALASLYTNGNVRASNVYASAKNPEAGVAPKKLTDLSLEHGVIYSGEIEFWGPPYPPVDMLRGLQFLDVRKQQEGGNLATAVVNRDDSRKTAEEIETAKQETNKLSAVQIALFSNFCLEVFSLQWAIIQNVALQGLVPLLQTELPPDPLAAAMGAAPTMANDKEVLSKTFDIAPAGDVDVVRRQERIQKRFMMLPIVERLPALAIEFLKDLLKETLPEDAAKYIAIIDQAMMDQTQMIIALAGMLQQAVTDDTGKLKPEFAQFGPELQRVQMMVQQMMTAPKPGAGGQPTGGAPSPSSGSGQTNMMNNNMMSSQMSKANSSNTSAASA